MLILNNMYVGGYLMVGENIGHEVINLLKSEDGKFYIYLNSQGTMPIKTIEKCEKNSPIDVLMVRPMTGGVYKVLGLAKDCKIDHSVNSINDKKGIYEKQKNVKYKIGNIKFLLGDIYNKNKFENQWTKNHKDSNEVETVLYTFMCENVYSPKNDLYITENENIANSNNIIYYFPKTGKETLRQYYYDFDINKIIKDYNGIYNKHNYEYLNVNNGKWKKIAKIDLNSGDHKIISDNNFYKGIRKDNDEVILSNSIIHFLNLLGQKNEFIKKISNVKSSFENPLREEFNIDLLFSNDKNGDNKSVDEIVIIENKLDSGINGVRSYTQSKDFTKMVEEVTDRYLKRYGESKDDKERSDICKERTAKICKYFKTEKRKKWSQLSKYYIFALNQLLDNSIFANKPIKDLITHIHPFLLVPKYREFEISKNKNKIDKILNVDYAFLNMYELITYKDIYDIFKKFSTESLIEEDKVRYNDFLEVLQCLSNDLNNSLEYEMMQRIYGIIKWCYVFA